MDEEKTAYVIMKSTVIRNPFAKNYYCSNCGYEPFECDNYCSHCGYKFLGIKTEEDFDKYTKNI